MVVVEEEQVAVVVVDLEAQTCGVLLGGWCVVLRED